MKFYLFIKIIKVKNFYYFYNKNLKMIIEN